MSLPAEFGLDRILRRIRPFFSSALARPPAPSPTRVALLPITITLGRQVIRRRFEVHSILNDLFIAVWFALDSVFFFESLYNLGISLWLFLIGSLQLGIRPALRLSRRTQLQRMTRGVSSQPS